MLKTMIYSFVWILGFVQSDKCVNNSSKGVTESWFCCNNHEEKNGACVECEIGYVSTDGLPCKQCSLGLWGRKCRDICRCHQNESCDIVYGCVGVTTVMSEKLKTAESKESTNVMTTSDSILAADKNDWIFLKREIIIYSISAGSIAVMVALASYCFKYNRKVQYFNKSSSPSTNLDQISSDRTNDQFNDESSVYDSIDEDNMVCNETLIRSIIRGEHGNRAETIRSASVDQDVSSSSYSDGDLADPSGEGYLNPYQPMIEVDVHSYHIFAKESSHESGEISSESPEACICSAVQVGNHNHQLKQTKLYDDTSIQNSTFVGESASKHTDNEESMSDSPAGNVGSHFIIAEQISKPMKIGIPITPKSDDVKNQEEKEPVVK